MLTTCALISLISCTEVKDWSDPVDNIPPGKINSPSVENLPGGACITYNLPSDQDLLGVKAIYIISEDGKNSEAFSSAYTDTIFVEGFIDTNERIVKLVTIDKSFNESEPVEVTVKPLKASIYAINESKKVKEAFGGIYVSWENPTRENIGVQLSYKDSLGFWVHDYTYYSNAEQEGYTFRGYDDKERVFRVQFLDAWNRFPEPLDTVLTPMYEEYLNPYNKFGSLRYSLYALGYERWRGDFPYELQGGGNRDFSRAFQNNPTIMWNVTDGTGNIAGIFTGDIKNDITVLHPKYTTWSLGMTVNISRMRAAHWRTRMLTGYAPKHIQIWGSYEEPKPLNPNHTMFESIAYWTSWNYFNGTDEWKKDWHLLVDAWFIPPSGITDPNAVTPEDIAWATNNRWDFDAFPETTTIPVRYLRVVIEEVWGGNSVGCQLCCIHFHGRILEE